MPFPKAVEDRAMRLFAVSYKNFKDRPTMEQALREFEQTLGRDIPGWKGKLRRVLEECEISEEAMEVFNQF